MPHVVCGLSEAPDRNRSLGSEETLMKIVIMGCGRVGARLALLFEREGHDVSVIDLYADSFARLGANFRGTTVAGTGIDEDVLKAAGIQQADIFLAVTQQDNANIMAAQIAKLMFQVPR